MPYKDPEKQREYQRRWVAKRKSQWIKANRPCAWCGSWESPQVDHIDQGTKVSHNVWTWSESRREAELAKCQVLCEDCHKEKSRNEHPKGEDTHTATITEAEALAIRRSTEPTRVLAQRYGFNRRTIQRIRSGDKWSHL